MKPSKTPSASQARPPLPLARRRFLAAAGAGALAGVQVIAPRSARAAGETIGQGSHLYRVVQGWGVLDPAKTPVAHCHEIVEDRRGRIILFQTDTRNNILIYDKSGKLLETWGTEYPGAHGLAIADENGEEFLFLTDTEKGIVLKTTLAGRVVMSLGRPVETGKYGGDAPYRPTNVMPAPDGTFYVGDGYGSHWVIHYDHRGQLLNVFGGPGELPHHLNTPHGGIFDTRDPDNPVLAICSRGHHAVKRFTAGGIYLGTTELPGLRVCQLARRGDFLYAPHLEGFLSVLGPDNQVVSNPGGTAPDYGGEGGGQPAPAMTKAGETFVHPHGIHVDADESIYVAQWNSGNTYPVKLERVA